MQRDDDSAEVWEPAVLTPLWLSHHYPEDYDHCVQLGDRYVCRRCVVLYPLAAVALTISLAAGGVGSASSALALAVGGLPALVEMVGEQLGWWAYSPRRQAAVSVPLGVGVGIGLARYLEAPGDIAFWVVVLTYAAIGALAILARSRRRADGAV